MAHLVGALEVHRSTLAVGQSQRLSEFAEPLNLGTSICDRRVGRWHRQLRQRDVKLPCLYGCAGTPAIPPPVQLHPVQEKRSGCTEPPWLVHAPKLIETPALAINAPGPTTANAASKLGKRIRRIHTILSELHLSASTTPAPGSCTHKALSPYLRTDRSPRLTGPENPCKDAGGWLAARALSGHLRARTAYRRKRWSPRISVSLSATQRA